MNNSITVPAGRYFTIGEVSKLCGLKQHVLRYWEEQFEQLQNLIRRNGRRYYTQKDVHFVLQLKELLYEQGLTINGAKKHLSVAQDAGETQLDAVTAVTIDEVLEELWRAKKIIDGED